MTDDRDKTSLKDIILISISTIKIGLYMQACYCDCVKGIHNIINRGRKNAKFNL